jgi:hypothetical protein
MADQGFPTEDVRRFHGAWLAGCKTIQSRKEVTMRKQLGILAIAALLGTPCVAGADMTMPSEFQAGMTNDNSQNGAEKLNAADTIKAEIVEIDGDRVVTETEDGKELVFHAEDSSVEFNVGDELELMIDRKANTGVILNVFPQDEERSS